MDATRGKLLAMPLRTPSHQTIETRNNLALLYLHIVPAIAGRIAAGRRCVDAQELEQIGQLALLQNISSSVDQYVRKRLEGAMRDSLDSRRKAGRETKESQHARIEPAFELRDSKPSPECAAIEHQETEYLRAAMSELPADDLIVLEQNYGNAPRKRGRVARPDAALSRLRERISLAQAA